MMLASSNALKSSAMYIGYLILKEIKKQEAGKISIYDVSKALKKAGITSSRQLILGLSFYILLILSNLRRIYGVKK